MSSVKQNLNIKRDTAAGFTSYMIIFSYAVCFCAASGLNLLNAFLSTAVCLIFSLPLKNKILAPDVFLLVPVLFIAAKSNMMFMPIAVVIGLIVCAFLSKFFPKKDVPECVIAGAGLGLALAATVLLTDTYFGIGAFGGTPLEMVESYRSLGFHPLFSGLLYGTITLFAMITYPFKFKKLNKYIPAEFLTLAFPLVLNLFLNPENDLTVINETDFTPVDLGEISNITLPSFSLSELIPVIFGGVALGFVLYAYNPEKNNGEKIFYGSNAVSGVISGIPVKEYEIYGFSPVSAIIALILSAVSVFLLPGLMGRIPLHCVGSLLIVSAWKSVPYKKISVSVKERGVKELVAVIITAAAFVFFDIFVAFAVSLIVAALVRRKDK